MVTSASPPRKVVVVSASVGAGHDGAAAELSRRLIAAGCIVARHDFLDLLPPTIGPLLNGSYKATLKALPGAWEFLLTRMHGRHGFGRGALGVAKLGRRRILRATRDAALVVSTYPLASKALGHLRETGQLAAPVVTFLTDMSVHPLWVHSGVDLHLALHGIAAEQARQLGAPEVRLVTPAVRPEFGAPGTPGAPDTPADPDKRGPFGGPADHTAPDDPADRADPTDRATLRARFGLPAGPLALVVAGSWGVGEILESARDIAATGLATPVVACGRNDALRTRVTRAGLGHPIGWITDMPGLIRACDVVVQNAGGLTSLEALATGVPVITYRCLPGHGRTNAIALQGAGWVPWVMDEAELPAALQRALATPPGATPFAGEEPAGAALALLDAAPAPAPLNGATAPAPLDTAPAPAPLDAAPAPVREVHQPAMQPATRPAWRRTPRVRP